MKLLLISNKSVHIFNYYNLIKTHFKEVVLISNDNNENLAELKQVYFNFSILNFLNYWNLIWKIRVFYLSEKPNYVHIHQANTMACICILALKKYNPKIILTTWGSDILLNPKRSFVHKAMVKYILKHTHYHTSDSKFMAQEMDTIAGVKLNTLIANFGIDVNYTENQTKQNIIYSNRLHKKLYNIDKIISAFKNFTSTEYGKNFKLIIAATGEETDNLKQLVTNLQLNEKVQFVGWLNKTDNCEWYKKALYYVSIPNSDATSISLLEAMHYGCIPVLSNLLPNKEWITHQYNGIIVYNLNSSFFDIINKLNITKIQQVNKTIINNEATIEVSFNRFKNLYELANKS